MIIFCSLIAIVCELYQLIDGGVIGLICRISHCGQTISVTVFIEVHEYKSFKNFALRYRSVIDGILSVICFENW